MKTLIIAFAAAVGISRVCAAPLPPNQTLNDAAFGDTAFVSVGANGTIYSSINSGPWELRVSGTTNNLQAVAYGDGMFVAAGANGTLLSSSNGVDWVVRGNGGTWSTPDIAYGSGMFVLGAKGPETTWTMLSSTNGVDWASVSVAAHGFQGSPLPFGGIAFGEGKFLAIGGELGASQVMASTDGVTWREQGANIPRATSVTQGPITYGSGKFAMVVNSYYDDDDDAFYFDQVLLSEDGINWQNTGMGVGVGDLRALAAGDCTFAAGGSYFATNAIYYTQGSYWWTNLAVAEAMSVRAIAYGDGKFVAFGSHIQEISVPHPSLSFAIYPERQEVRSEYYAYFTFNPPLCFEGPASYQWRHNGVPIPNQTFPYLELYPVTTNHAGAYTVVALNSAGLSITSSVATLIVTNFVDPQPFAPQILSPSEPAQKIMSTGWADTLYASVTGSPYPARQWRRNGIDIPGATNSSLSFFNVDERAAGAYTIVASNYLGSVTSSVITVVVTGTAPTVWLTDSPVTAMEGSEVRLPWSVGPGAPHADLYVFKDGTNTLLPLSLSGQLILRDVSLSDAGEYFVVASNAAAMITSAVLEFNVIPAGRLDRWTRRNPLPQNDPLLEIAHGNGRFVAVGEVGAVVVSTNGADWTLHRMKVPLRLTSIAFGNGVFVAIDHVAIMSSSDGVAWATRLNRPVTWPGLKCVAFGNGRFVAGGHQEVLTSENGVDWEQVRLPVNVPALFHAITFGNGLFVAISEDVGGPVWTSPDGVNWTPNTGRFSDRIEDLAFGAGLFVAVGDEGVVYTSPDGVTWTFRDSETSNRLIDVTYGNGRFVAVGARGRIVSSANGTSWRRESSGTPDRLEGVTFGDGLFVAVGENGTTISSPNGATWGKRNRGVTRDLDGIAVGNGTIVVVGKGGNIVTSDDGTNFIQRAIATENDLHGVGWGDNLFVAVGEPETIVTSPDGVLWTLRHLGTNSSLKAVAKANGTWVVVGTGGTVLTSTDGVSWTQRESYTLNDLNSVAYGNGLFVAVGDNLPPNGTLITSPDGVNWTRRNQYIGKNLRAVAFANGTFVATGNDGAVLLSTDGLEWENLFPFLIGNYDSNLRGITHWNGIWVVVGNFGLVMTSPNARDWLARPRQGIDNLHGVVPFEGKFVAIGNRGTILQSDFYSQVGAALGARLVSGGVEVSISGEPGAIYSLQASEGLSVAAWEEIDVVSFSREFTNSVIFEPNVTNVNSRFYRALSR